MSQPLVSIVVPCYNAEPWVADTLESALAQTWPRCEIIVVDDGSRDDSLAVARRFEPRGVRVVAQANAGASAARNRGVRESRGEFIQYLDADDQISPAKISAQLAVLAPRAPGTLGTSAWGRFSDTPASARFVDAAVFRDFTPIEFLLLAANTGAMFQPAAWLVPRQLGEQAGPWNETLTLNDDGEYFARVVLASSGLAFCPDPAARTYYRTAGSSSLSRRRSRQAIQSQFSALELTAQHILAAEDSARTRQAIANSFQRFIHDYFPFPPELMRAARDRVAEMGGSTLSGPPMGPRTAALARFVGWKNVWRLKRLLSL